MREIELKATDHVLGRPTAALTLVQYGDYACPYTTRMVPVVTEAQRAFGSEMRFIFRHFPLIDRHPQALVAAEAAEAAAAQGSFWEMHLLLCRDPLRLEPSHLRLRASALGLDELRFHADLEQHLHRPRVLEDLETGDRLGVTSTPTFFINGHLFAGPADASLLGRIEEVLRGGSSLST
jgi:Na+:H+ antiporter, NhaA family